MDRKQMVLAAMAPAENGSHTPVQIQKLLFLLDQNIAEAFDGPHFDFRPYDYGPFDRNVYEVLEELARDGLVDILGEPWHPWRSYRLTPAGHAIGYDLAVNHLAENIQDYLWRVSNFVRSQSFAGLVSAIYKAYPHMKTRSVFKE